MLVSEWWQVKDLHFRPSGYEPDELTTAPTCYNIYALKLVAEEVGFEPTEPLRVLQISNLAH